MIKANSVLILTAEFSAKSFVYILIEEGKGRKAEQSRTVVPEVFSERPFSTSSGLEVLAL